MSDDLNLVTSDHPVADNLAVQNAVGCDRGTATGIIARLMHPANGERLLIRNAEYERLEAAAAELATYRARYGPLPAAEPEPTDAAEPEPVGVAFYTGTNFRAHSVTGRVDLTRPITSFRQLKDIEADIQALANLTHAVITGWRLFDPTTPEGT